MERDLEISKNVLSTMIRQTRGPFSFVGANVEASYLSGYGVTFRLPPQSQFMVATVPLGEIEELVEVEVARSLNGRATAPRDRGRNRNPDSIQQANKTKLLALLQDFLLDYSDLLTQLPAQEKITITNRGAAGEGARWLYMGNATTRGFISLEAQKSDMMQYRQGKLSREQAGKLIKITDTRGQEAEPDIELFSSILGRLYSSGLSKTYYANGDVPFERLRDFGVIYYLNVYSSSEESGVYSMPTLKLKGLSEADRNDRVTELYPTFEQELKDNLLEYGRTIRSLKPGETLGVSVKLTRCTGCGIPSTVELSVKGEVLTNYSTGKISKENALAKVSVKRGPGQ